MHELPSAIPAWNRAALHQMNVKLSVIVPTLNCAPFIGATIESVLRQGVRPYELLVVDDGSTDHTNALLRTFGSNIVVRHQPNQGVAVARNCGMDIAQGDWLLFLDADDVLEDDAIGRLQSQAHPSAGVVYGHSRHIDVDGNLLHEHRSRDCTGPAGSAARQNFGGAAFTPGCAIVRASLAREIRFDQRFAPCEDRDFWIRCGTRTEFVEVPYHVLRYRVRAGSHSRDRVKQVVASVAVRLRALEWFQESSSPPIDVGLSPHDVMDQTLLDVFWQREWDIVDRLLQFAAEQGLDSPTLRLIRRKRSMPAWVHRYKDSIDDFTNR